MRSSTSVLKKGRMPQFNPWEPADFTPESPLEEEELLMYAEGVTEPQTWIAPEERGIHEKEHVWDKQLNLDEHRQEIISVLVEKKKGSRTSPVFKQNEIPVFPFDLPDIELLQEKPQEEIAQEEQVESEGEQILPEHLLEEARQQAQQLLDQARIEAEAYLEQARIQAHAESEQLIERTKAEAAQIIAQANQSRALITQEAREKGFEVALEEARHLIQTAQSLIQSLEKTHDLILERSEEEVIQLLKTIVQNLFSNGAALPENVLKEAFQQAVEEAKPLGNLRIRANPQDIAVLGELWLKEQQQLRNITVEWLPSEDILRGGCIIEGDFGSLDARVDAKLERILQKIEEVKQLPLEVWEESLRYEEDETSLLQEGLNANSQNNHEMPSEEAEENVEGITLLDSEQSEQEENNPFQEMDDVAEDVGSGAAENADELPLNLNF